MDKQVNKHKKRDENNLLKLTEAYNLKKNILDDIKTDDERKKEKDKEKGRKYIKEKLYKNSNILSDSEATRGDTLTDYAKKKYVYRKVKQGIKLCFAINKNSSNNTNTNNNQTNDKKNKLNSSISLNKYNESNNGETAKFTNNDFYRRQNSFLDNYNSNFTNFNIKSFHFPNVSTNYLNYSNIIKEDSYSYNENIINIEDLLIIEEKFSELIRIFKLKDDNIANVCFELLNSYEQSSIYNNISNYFKNLSAKITICTSILYFIYNVIICYHFSFDFSFFNTCYQYLGNILEISHKSFLLLCELILLKISSNAKNNIWVLKLKNMLKFSLKHIELNNEEYTKFLMGQESFNYKNTNIYEIKFYSNKINRYLQLFLNSITIDNNLKNDFCFLFDNINTHNLSEDKLLYFFKSKIIRIINENASVAGIEASSPNILSCEDDVEVPYLKFPLKKKFSLVLDLDETLISFKLDPNDDNKGTIKFRPYIDTFLQKVQEKYEIIVFTSGTQDYADPLEDAIEQERKYFDARLYRQHTITCGKDIVKDISRIGRPLDKIIIVENIPQNYRLQKENGILIKSFYGEDIYDNALLSLSEILIKIHNEFNDVRKGIQKYKDEILDKVSTNLSKNNNKW